MTNNWDEKIKVNSHGKSRKRLSLEGVFIIYLIYHILSTVYILQNYSLSYLANSYYNDLPYFLILPFLINIILSAILTSLLLIAVYFLASYPYYQLIKNRLDRDNTDNILFSFYLGASTLALISSIFVITTGGLDNFINIMTNSMVDLNTITYLYLVFIFVFAITSATFLATIFSLVIIKMILFIEPLLLYIVSLSGKFGYFVNRLYYKSKEFLLD